MKSVKTTVLITLLALGSAISQDAAISMHMNLNHTASGDIQVNEVRVPSGSIWKNTYYESIGIRSNESLNVGHGYAGIQESSDGRGNRVHIFSLWDEAGVNYIPHLGYGMETETFGGEGNGSKTWCLSSDETHPLYWQPDVWYTHVIRAWNVGSHTHYGFFVRDGEGGKWRHLSTIGMPHADIRINSNSKNDAFLENWTENPHNGSYRREMHLRNSMRRDLSGNWTTAQKAYYSVNNWDFSTRSVNWKTNWDAGIDSDETGSYYYMITGGSSTSPTAPLSYADGTYASWFDNANSNTNAIYDAISLTEVLFTDLGNGSMEVMWDRDSTTLPQLNYSIKVYDTPSLTGESLVNEEYDYSSPQTYNAPNTNSDTINISSLDLSNLYYLVVEVTDIFDNTTSKTVQFGNGIVSEYLTISSPNGGESFMVDDEMTITWNTNLDSDSIDIFLYDGTEMISEICREDASKGTYIWTIPSDLVASDSYKLFMEGIIPDSLDDYSNGTFSIQKPDSTHLLLDQSLITVHSVDSEQPGADNAKENVLDGNSSTIWHTNWATTETTPHEIVLKTSSNYNFTGLKYLPRQDGSNGRIGEYEIYISTDGSNWGSAVASGSFTNSNEEQQLFFSETAGQYVKLVALSEVTGQAWTSVAELNLFYNGEAGKVLNLHNTTTGIGRTMQSIQGNRVQLNLPHGKEFTVSLIQLNGRTIHTQSIHSSGLTEIDYSETGISQGVYLLRISGENGAEHARINLN